ncbi:hypothetical protein [Nitrospira sp. Ecomares 2.1]
MWMQIVGKVRLTRTPWIDLIHFLNSCKQCMKPQPI